MQIMESSFNCLTELLRSCDWALVCYQYILSTVKSLHLNRHVKEDDLFSLCVKAA